MAVEEEDSSAIETTQAGLSGHEGRRPTRVKVFFFFAVTLDALIPYYEKYLFYY